MHCLRSMLASLRVVELDLSASMQPGLAAQAGERCTGDLRGVLRLLA